MRLPVGDSRSGDTLLRVTTPYRDGKPLTDVIPPDRRKQRAIMMIVGGALGGALLLELVHRSHPAAPTHLPDTPPQIADLISKNHGELRERCFDPRTELNHATVNLYVVIDGHGAVLNSHYEGSDSKVTICVEREVRQWQFPALGDQRSARVPIVFDRS
jgi:hypothetical protein